jgi:hypothetical protein
MFADLAATRIVPVHEGGTMSMRKLITLAGLALAVVALGPASALANAAGTDRPVKGTISGTVSLNVLTGAFTADATGVATHLGDNTVSLEGAVAITPEGVFGSGTGTIVAADGDQMIGTFTLETPGQPGVAHTTTIVMTVTGGTGRFSDASGTLTSISEVSPISFDGVTLVNSVEGTVTGQVSY